MITTEPLFTIHPVYHILPPPAVASILLFICCFARLFSLPFLTRLFFLFLLFSSQLIAVGWTIFCFQLFCLERWIILIFAPSQLLFSDLCLRGKRHHVRLRCSDFKIYRLLPCCDRVLPEGHETPVV